MPSSKKPRKPARSRHFGMPQLLGRLPISEKSIRKIQAVNDTHLLRFYFGTADQADVDAIYTHLVISWGLAGRMREAKALRDELWKGIELVNRSLAPDVQNDKESLVPVVLQDIVRASLDLWRRTTAAELDRTIDEINVEIAAFRAKRDERA